MIMSYRGNNMKAEEAKRKSHLLALFLFSFMIASGTSSCGILKNRVTNAVRQSMPKPARIYSANKMYFFEVHPNENSGEDGQTQCKGYLTKKDANGDFSRVWEAVLAADNYPWDAWASNDGKYVITFEGSKNHVLSIYGKHGNLLRNFDETELRSLAKVPKSTNVGGYSWKMVGQSVELNVGGGETISIDLPTDKEK